MSGIEKSAYKKFEVDLMGLSSSSILCKKALKKKKGKKTSLHFILLYTTRYLLICLHSSARNILWLELS